MLSSVRFRDWRRLRDDGQADREGVCGYHGSCRRAHQKMTLGRRAQRRALLYALDEATRHNRTEGVVTALAQPQRVTQRLQGVVLL